MSFYEQWSGLREESMAMDEAFVQRLWFEQLYQPEMTTLTGEKVCIVQPGFWNHGPGPDFLGATLTNSGGQREIGSVEIHRDGREWNQHGHEKDPHYDGVILHVVWKAGPRLFFAADSRHRAVRTVELSSQLRVPLLEARRHFTTTDLERKVGARMGLCRKELAELAVPDVVHLLEDAGWFRFQRRAELWSMREKLHGFDQALWLGLADALGYSRNREAFGSLAQRLPVHSLQRARTNLQREALLFGLAGFLPERTLPRDHGGRQWFRALWDEWWKLRAEWDEQSLPRHSWNLRGVRPLNRPERRLAILSLLSEKTLWKRFTTAALGSFPELWELVESLEHPFWDRHYTLESGSKEALQLMGSGRCLRFWFNVAGPLALARGRERMREQLQAIRTSEIMHPASVAALRLLGGRRLGAPGNSLLVKEGLLQIYQDFCVKDFDQCGACDFPDFIRKWKA